MVGPIVLPSLIRRRPVAGGAVDLNPGLADVLAESGGLVADELVGRSITWFFRRPPILPVK
jgi:hypothetical protein